MIFMNVYTYVPLFNTPREYCRVRGLNRRACLSSELVTGITVAMVAQRYASGSRKRKVRRSIPDRTEPFSLRFLNFEVVNRLKFA